MNRSARPGWGAAAALAALLLSGCTTGGTAVTNCTPRGVGALCLRVIGSRGIVRDVIAYLAAQDSPLAGQTWRLVLTASACDPRAGTPSCSPSQVYPGPTRYGPPPTSGSCRNPSTGEFTTTPHGCHDSVAQEMATLGDWSGLSDLANGNPHTFTAPTWLCVSEQVQVRGVWRAPAADATPQPAQACSRVVPS